MSERKIKSVEGAVEAILEYVQGISVIKSYNLTGNANKKVSDAIDERTRFHTAWSGRLFP